MRGKYAKLIALILAILMVLTMIVPIISLLVGAATPVWETGNIAVRRNGSQVTQIATGLSYQIEFDAVVDLGVASTGATPAPTPARPAFGVNTDAWSRASDERLTFRNWTPMPPAPGESISTRWRVRVALDNITYRSTNRNNWLQVSADPVTISGVNFEWTFNVILSPDLFERPSVGGGDGEDGDPAFTPNIIVENVVAHDSQGNVIRDIDRDTPPFSIQITFVDHGLVDVNRRDFDNNAMSAFLLNPGELIPQGSTRGTLRTASFSSGDPPRFVATFHNLLYAGGAANFVEATFRVQYSINGERVFGEGAARFFGILREGDEEDELDPFTPFIIIREHSFGGEQVEAGSVFTLAMTFANTSAEVALNNIIMVVSPVSTEQHQSALTIASSTNTYFFESLPAGGRASQSVDILVMATAPAGSQAVNVQFRYEYVIGSQLKNGEISTIIHIPINQVDRFAVDPITDFSEFLNLGEEGYVVVSFVNLGQSDTFNVSGFLLDREGNQGQTERHGTLKAGESASFEFFVTPQETGPFEGVIIISYENHNGEEMQIENIFNLWVDEPFFPERPGMGFPGMEEMSPQGNPWWRYALFIGGGLFIAAPIAFYIAKRVKEGGSEEFDEDF